jgi:hypothetical protein
MIIHCRLYSFICEAHTITKFFFDSFVGNQNTQDMEVDGPPLGRIETSGEGMSVSNEAIVTIPSSSEATPSLPVQELVESNVHALEITSQLMLST